MKKKVILILKLLFFVLILFLLYRELKNYNIRHIIEVVNEYRISVIILGLLTAGLNYFILTFYDLLALRNEDEKLSFKKIIPVSFTAFAFGNSLGFSGISSSAIRLRLYGALKIPEGKIIKISLFTMVSFWVGLITAAAVSAAVNMKIYAVPLIILLMIYCWKIPDRKKLSIKRSIVLKQLIVGFIDWAAAGLVLYIFLPERPDFFLFLGIFCLAQFAGVVSNLPGGIGTFEFVFLKLLGSSNGILAAIFLYRVIYYLVPLLGAIITYLVLEFTKKAEKITKTYEFLIPILLAAFCFTSGMILLISGAIPPAISRITFLEKIIPLGVLEISHFLGSIIGIVLILLSYAIKNRINLAYRVSVCALVFGIFSLLFKGAGYGTVMVLIFVLILLIPSKKFFYRKSSLFHNGINPEWTVLIIMVLISSIWLGLFSYKQTPYSSLLWWQFEFHKGAPRVLRMIFAIGLFTFIFSVIKILRPVPQEKYTVLNDSREAVDEIMKTSSDSESNLVYLNDKRIYFSDNKKAFLMYGKYQNTRIVMGDPIGNESEISEIIWDYFLETKNSLESLIFYEVGKENLHYYLDIGLTILKIGEEALVNLENFSLKGDKKKTLRYTYNKLTKEEYEMKIIKKEDIEPYLDELERISDIWLKTKSVKEKSFSLGNFTKEYMRNFDTAVIIKDNEIYAFANLFYSGDKNEISIDLMRYDADKAPNGIMDFLFMKIMEHGKENEFKYFNLGMAPLSGIEDKNTGLVNLWNKAGIFIYKHGNHFYNFDGLKKFKNKFDPEWKPKYVAFYGNPLKIVSNTVSLISGGMKGFFKK